MNKAVLKRITDNDKVTIGEFTFETLEGISTTLFSLELPWKDNKTGISCIPEGIYKVITTFSNRFKQNMWEVLNVPNRKGIRIHPANYVQQLEGCIALGIGTADINNDGIMDITLSKKAMEIARKELGSEFILEIVNKYEKIA